MFVFCSRQGREQSGGPPPNSISWLVAFRRRMARADAHGVGGVRETTMGSAERASPSSSWLRNFQTAAAVKDAPFRRAAARRSPQAILDSRSGLENGRARARRRGAFRGGGSGCKSAIVRRNSVVPLTAIRPSAPEGWRPPRIRRYFEINFKSGDKMRFEFQEPPRLSVKSPRSFLLRVHSDLFKVDWRALPGLFSSHINWGILSTKLRSRAARHRVLRTFMAPSALIKL
jgi:hypothetical protein